MWSFPNVYPDVSPNIILRTDCPTNFSTPNLFILFGTWRSTGGSGKSGLKTCDFCRKILILPSEEVFFYSLYFKRMAKTP